MGLSGRAEPQGKILHGPIFKKRAKQRPEDRSPARGHSTLGIPEHSGVARGYPVGSLYPRRKSGPKESGQKEG